MSNFPDILVGQLFPNPPLECGQVYLALVGTFRHKVVILVSSKEGKAVPVKTDVRSLSRSGGTVVLNCADLPHGKYEVTISCGNHIENRTLTIEAPREKIRTWKDSLSWLF